MENKINQRINKLQRQYRKNAPNENKLKNTVETYINTTTYALKVN